MIRLLYAYYQPMIEHLTLVAHWPPFEPITLHVCGQYCICEGSVFVVPIYFNEHYHPL